ncbi:hypothetical protein ADJ73_12090 [Arsenicicoccus sp. oral taxon 190]|nr:hypothetical protein ADJ73_12090 [Arsenicicoccus sp. oral taxon 190]
MGSVGFLIGVALRRVRERPGAVLAVVACALVACMATATAQVHAAATSTAAHDQVIAQAPPDGRSVVISGTPTAGVARTEVVVRALADRLPGAQVRRWVTSSVYGVQGGEERLRVELAQAPDAMDASTVVTGRWPQEAAEVTVPQVAADRLGWRPGTTVRLRQLVPTQPPGPPLRVVGTYRPRSGQDPAWRDDPRHAAGLTDGDFLTVGPVLVARDAAPAAVPALDRSASVTWRVLPPMGAPDLAGRVTDVVAAAGQESLLDGLQVRSSIPEVLARADADRARTSAAIAGPTVLLGAVALVGIALTGLLLGALHRGSDRLLRTRGASAGQLVTLALAGALVVLPGAVAAVLLAPLVAGLLPGAPVARAEMSWQTWLVGLTTAALGVLVLTASTLGSGLDEPRRAGRLVDAVLVALAAFAWWRLRSVAPADPVTVAAPAFVVLGAGVVAIRLLPVLGRPAARLARRARGLPLSWAGWTWRAPSREALGTRLLTVLTAAVGVLTVVQLTTNDDVMARQLLRRSPAPVVVRLDPAAAQSPARLAAVRTRLGGTATAARVSTVDVGAAGRASLVAVDLDPAVVADPALLGAPGWTTAQGPAWRAALAALPTRDAGAAPPVPAVITTDLARTLAVGPGATTTVQDAGRSVALRVVGVADRLPGQPLDVPSAVLVDRPSLQRLPGATAAAPDQLWSDGSPDAAAALTLPGDGVQEVVLRRTLAASADVTVPLALRGILVLLAGATLVLCLVAAFAGTVAALSAGQRTRAVLHALGAPQRHVRRGVLLGELGQVVLAVVAGAAVGLLASLAVARPWSPDGSATGPQLAWPPLLLVTAGLALVLWLVGWLALRAPARSWSSLLREGDRS